MSVKIRLTRMGRKKRPFYRIVVTDSRTPRDGRYIECLGTYNPLTNPPEVKVEGERATHWLDRGAIPTDTVRNILQHQGVIHGRYLTKQGLEETKIDEEMKKWEVLQIERERREAAKVKVKKAAKSKKAASEDKEPEEEAVALKDEGQEEKFEEIKIDEESKTEKGPEEKEEAIEEKIVSVEEGEEEESKEQVEPIEDVHEKEMVEEKEEVEVKETGEKKEEVEVGETVEEEEKAEVKDTVEEKEEVEVKETAIREKAVRMGLLSGDAEDEEFARESYFVHTPLHIPNRRQVLHLHHWFEPMVRWPKFSFLFRALIRLPLTPLYEFFFKVQHAASLKRFYRIRLLPWIRFLWASRGIY